MGTACVLDYLAALFASYDRELVFEDFFITDYFSTKSLVRIPVGDQVAFVLNYLEAKFFHLDSSSMFRVERAKGILSAMTRALALRVRLFLSDTP